MRVPAGAVLLPGFVDTHVHINAPGTDWEGFATAVEAAARAGITTVVDMPLDSVAGDHHRQGAPRQTRRSTV